MLAFRINASKKGSCLNAVSETAETCHFVNAAMIAEKGAVLERAFPSRLHWK